MKNEIDAMISAYLRLAELCGTGDEAKKKFYMSKVEELLHGNDLTTDQMSIFKEAIVFYFKDMGENHIRELVEKNATMEEFYWWSRHWHFFTLYGVAEHYCLRHPNPKYNDYHFMGEKMCEHETELRLYFIEQWTSKVEQPALKQFHKKLKGW